MGALGSWVVVNKYWRDGDDRTYQADIKKILPHT